MNLFHYKSQLNSCDVKILIISRFSISQGEFLCSQKRFYEIYFVGVSSYLNTTTGRKWRCNAVAVQMSIFYAVVGILLYFSIVLVLLLSSANKISLE